MESSRLVSIDSSSETPFMIFNFQLWIKTIIIFKS